MMQFLKMKRFPNTRKSLKILTLLASGLAAGIANAEPPQTFWQWLATTERFKEVAPVTNDVYNEECGSCHFAFPPGLLPTASWQKLLAPEALADHFGENAELDDDALKTVQAYADANAADKSWYKRSRKIALATSGEDAPLRITDVRYIKRKHHELSDRMFKDNPDVQSRSNCTACHTKAEQGIFDSDTVDIPNYADFAGEEDDD